jgi:osmoprotectant transport system permease protein
MSSAAVPLAQTEVRDPGEGGQSCVADNGTFCFDWAVDNFDRYTTPLWEHVILVLVPVVLGFLIAFAMAVLSHRQRWLVPPFLATTGILYTIPSIAFFFLLLPITGRGRDTALIALTAFTLQIIYRNIVAGLDNVPPSAKDAGRGMGMTPGQLLRRVELPLAIPEIVAGLRIATVSTVAIATLAVFAGGGGLGDSFVADIDFRTNVIIASVLCVAMALVFDLLLVLLQRYLTPWRYEGSSQARREGRRRLMLRRAAT